MLNMDFEKACKKVTWYIIPTTLQIIGFGQMYCRMIDILFTNAKELVCLDGYYS